MSFKGRVENKIIFGCARISGTPFDLKLLRYAYDRGIRIFDTALSYGSDVVLGSYFSGQSDVRFGTKVGANMHDAHRDPGFVSNIYRRFGKRYLSLFPSVKRRLLKIRTKVASEQSRVRPLQLISKDLLEERVTMCLTNLRLEMPEYILLHEPQTLSLTEDASIYFDSLVRNRQARYTGVGFGMVSPGQMQLRGDFLMCHWSSKNSNIYRPRFVARHGLLRDGGLDYLDKVPELDQDYLVISVSTPAQLDTILAKLESLWDYGSDNS